MAIKTPIHKMSAASRKSIRTILAFIKKHDNFLVSGHVRSDGDALGSQLAFHSMLKKMKKRAHVVCDQGAAPDFRFMPGSENVGADPSALHPPYTAVFTFDSGSWGRLERISAALDRKGLIVVDIDHHASNDRFGDINWIDPTFSSTGEMVWELIKAAGVKVDRSMIVPIYTAIVTDTGRFAFSNTTTETLLNAAELVHLGMKPQELTKLLYRQKTIKQLKFMSKAIERINRTDDGRVAWISIPRELERREDYEIADTQEYIDMLMQLKETEIAILLREMENPARIKVSWRTVAGLDGIELSKPYGGGGHPRASGASLHEPLEAATKRVVDQAIAMVTSGRRLTEKQEAAISKM